MQFQEAKQALARKLNIDYTNIPQNDLFSDADLGAFVQTGLFRAWDYRPWPFTRKSKQVTSISTDYYDYPQDVMLGSVYLLRVGGKKFIKIDYEDYLKEFEDNPASTEKLWTETETYILINRLAYTVGDLIDMTGKKLAPALSNATDLLPFSPQTDNEEHSGNDAIVQLAYAEALRSKKLNNPQQAILEERGAYVVLDLLWKPFADAKARTQTRNRPGFDVPDFFGPGQASTPGTFNIR